MGAWSTEADGGLSDSIGTTTDSNRTIDIEALTAEAQTAETQTAEVHTFEIFLEPPPCYHPEAASSQEPPCYHPGAGSSQDPMPGAGSSQGPVQPEAPSPFPTIHAQPRDPHVPQMLGTGIIVDYEAPICVETGSLFYVWFLFGSFIKIYVCVSCASSFCLGSDRYEPLVLRRWQGLMRLYIIWQVAMRRSRIQHNILICFKMFRGEANFKYCVA